MELVPLTDPALVPARVARVLDVSERDAITPTDGLARALADRDLLVVLDNCEHVLDGVAGLVALLLERCRRVRVLATSRERLDVPGEHVLVVPPLGLPEDGSAAAVGASEAGAVFAARARAAQLETVRQFAASRLASSGEETAVNRRLLEWTLDLAQAADEASAGTEWPARASRLSTEQDNIRAALSWALGGHEPEAGRELAARLARWWIATGRYSESSQFLASALALPAAAPHAQARVLLGAAWSAYNLGDNTRAARLASQGIAARLAVPEDPGTRS